MAAHPGKDDGSASTIAEIGGRGGGIATFLSALALTFSGLSFYESVMKQADLEFHVPPVIHYARDGDGEIELFAIPLTIVNSGARTGTVLNFELEVENLKAGSDGKKRRYYSAFLGEHQVKSDEINRSFAPVSLAGRSSYSETIRFYPIGNPLPRLVEEAGDYRFTLVVSAALPENPDFLDKLFRPQIAPIRFERTLPYMSEQMLGLRRATISMQKADWKAPAPSAP